jgi:formylmethanofuran dehydrogenase subunit E
MMKLSDIFDLQGRGVMATADASGKVNVAIYARPRIIDEGTVAWGMSEGRTWGNLKENGKAAYLFMSDKSFQGVRLVLELKEMREAGDLLEDIKEHMEAILNHRAAEAVKHVAIFRITEIRALI